MALTYNQFQIVNILSERPGLTQQQLSDATGLRLAIVDVAVRECRKAGLIEDGRLTAHGMAALKPYAVDNAVIMAAGLSSRFVPISYERPKGLLRVRGEVLIERQIRQLREAGVSDVIVVVGYKKESFYYLEDEFNVKIVVNRHFMDRNNNESLWLVRELLGNTYVCSSDNYFEENPFERHVWGAYYAAEWSEGITDEWCLGIGPHGRITDIKVGGSHAWYMIGHAYFDRAFSERFCQIMEEEHGYPKTYDKLWESLYREHIREFDMRVRRYNPPIIHEFDSLDELRGFDPLFLENVDSEIFDHIVAVIGCEKSEIHDVYPLKQGLTNFSFHFSTSDGEWVYRHPGVGTEFLIDRQAELKGLETARSLGLDSTFVFENPKRGWKISRFVPNAKNLDAHNDAQLKVALEMAARLHSCGATVKRCFSFHDEGRDYERRVLERGPIADQSWPEMRRQADQLDGFMREDGGELVLCHNDFFGLNFLVSPDKHIDLIDWEYAGMSDYANDFGTFAVCEQLNENEMRRALTYYFGRHPTEAEWRHNLGQVGMAGWCWYAWSLLKEAEGEDVGEWSHVYYRYGKKYLRQALTLYDGAN